LVASSHLNRGQSSSLLSRPIQYALWKLGSSRKDACIQPSTSFCSLELPNEARWPPFMLQMASALAKSVALVLRK
jgi:hypothetical protein